MSFNANNQNEVELMGQARPYIERGNKQLQKDFLLNTFKLNLILRFFMVNHFIKPNPRSELTKNETDNGVSFLMELKGRGFIRFKKSDIDHIINWYVDGEKRIKRWFDTVDEDNPILIYIEDVGRNYLLLSENEPPIVQPKERSQPSTYNIHLENPMGTVIGDNTNQSFQAHNISNTNRSKSNPNKMHVIIKWILATLAALTATLLAWWLTKGSTALINRSLPVSGANAARRPKRLRSRDVGNSSWSREAIAHRPYASFAPEESRFDANLKGMPNTLHPFKFFLIVGSI